MEIDGSKFLLTWPQSDNLTNEMILEHLKEECGEMEYAIICEELHADGLAHHHAVVLTGKRLRRSRNIFVIDIFQCNVKRLKTQADVKRAVTYVMKDANYIEHGKRPDYTKKLDKREKAFYALQHSNAECVASGYFSFSELTKLQSIRNLFINDWPQFQKRVVMWYYGPTGSGKTRTAFGVFMEEYGLNNIWISNGRVDNFFNGYTGQKAVILDDFRPGFCKFEFLLRLLDGYPVMVNVKGGYCNWMAEKIIITAPVPPNEMYVNHQTGEEWDNLDQLIRRIDIIQEFS